MNYKKLNSFLGKMDIYLLDQVMKKRFSNKDKILDAGCGKGRNLIALNNLGFNVEGCDRDEKVINALRFNNPDIKLAIAEITALPYKVSQFDHVICNAVLHFASSDDHFIQMLEELQRILKPKGTLFIRMASIFTLRNYKFLSDGQFKLPDETTRFLLQDKQLERLKLHFKFLEPLKTVNVNNVRCMSNLILQKH